MDVDQLVKTIDPDLRGLVQAVRHVVMKVIPAADELVKWGNPTYVANGKNVACIMIYKDHVNLGFFQGVMLKSKMLEGTGKGLRHVKVRMIRDVDEKEFTRLLREAVTMAKSESA